MPLPAGDHRIPWDDKDETDVVELGTREDLGFYGIGYLLPATSVITTGNETLTYRAYREALPKDHPVKPYRAPTERQVPISLQWDRPLRMIRAIEFGLSRPVINDGKLECTVTIEPSCLDTLRGEAYEIIAYVDYQLVAEEERGSSPCPLVLDIAQLAPGEHTLTVNVASATDRVGTASVKFVVPQPTPPWPAPGVWLRAPVPIAHHRKGVALVVLPGSLQAYHPLHKCVAPLAGSTALSSMVLVQHP